MGRYSIASLSLLAACQVARVQAQPMATIVDHLCHDGIGLAPCTQYAETWEVSEPELLVRAAAAGFTCQGPLCERRSELGGRPVHLRLVIDPHRLWLEIELPRGRGETARDLLPLFTELAARLRGQLGFHGDDRR